MIKQKRFVVIDIVIIVSKSIMFIITDTHIVQPVFESDDAKEGARAFAEKRKPVWKAR